MRYLDHRDGLFHRLPFAEAPARRGNFVVGFDGMTISITMSCAEGKRHAILARSNGFKPVIGMLEDKAALDRAAELAGAR